MLNTDFELFYDMDLDSNFQALCDPTASVTDCAPAATYATANVYAQVMNFLSNIIMIAMHHSFFLRTMLCSFKTSVLCTT